MSREPKMCRLVLECFQLKVNLLCEASGSELNLPKVGVISQHCKRRLSMYSASLYVHKSFFFFLWECLFMVSFCEDFLIGGSNIHVKKGVRFGTFAWLFLLFSVFSKKFAPFSVTWQSFGKPRIGRHVNLLSLLKMAATTTTVSLRKNNGKILAINSCNYYTVGVCQIVM